MSIFPSKFRVLTTVLLLSLAGTGANFVWACDTYKDVTNAAYEKKIQKYYEKKLEDHDYVKMPILTP